MVAFCVLAGLVFFQGNDEPVQLTTHNPNPNAIYTEQDVDRKVKEALAKQQDTIKQSVETAAAKEQTVKYQKPKSSQPASSNQSAKSRRPLSRAEREQLAADLRLLSTRDDEPIQLLGDRINQ